MYLMLSNLKNAKNTKKKITDSKEHFLYEYMTSKVPASLGAGKELKLDANDVYFDPKIKPNPSNGLYIRFQPPRFPFNCV